jgi:uncharacterized protein with NAD-binding domain and iron-sulfur cluster
LPKDAAVFQKFAICLKLWQTCGQIIAKSRKICVTKSALSPRWHQSHAHYENEWLKSI